MNAQAYETIIFTATYTSRPFDIDHSKSSFFFVANLQLFLLDIW